MFYHFQAQVEERENSSDPSDDEVDSGSSRARYREGLEESDLRHKDLGGEGLEKSFSL